MVAYLDYNASAPIEPEVINFMIDIYANNIGNASSRTHLYGVQAKEIVEKSRKIIANILGLDQMEVIFTSGSTESNNTAIFGLEEYAKESGKNHFITSSIEHKAIIEPMKYLEKKGYRVDFINPDGNGRISADKVISKVTDKTAMVSIMHVNSETGIIQPVQEIGDFLKDKDVYFHIDATQSFGKMNDELKEIAYDMLSISAHKIRGPQGIGALIIKRNKHLRDNITPLILGGGQEFGFRSGTLPVALVGGFGRAAEISEKKSSVRKAKCKEIKSKLMKDISCTKYVINGDSKYCINNTINLSFRDVDAEGIFVATKDYYAMSNGSACVSGAYTTSYVLKAMGLDEKRISEAIRISWDYDTVVDFSELVDYVKGQQEE